jgi:hypothetical protein
MRFALAPLIKGGSKGRFSFGVFNVHVLERLKARKLANCIKWTVSAVGTRSRGEDFAEFIVIFLVLEYILLMLLGNCR